MGGVGGFDEGWGAVGFGWQACEAQDMQANAEEPHSESVVAEDDGTVVLAVADDSPHALVDGPQGLLRVPLLPRKAGGGGCRGGGRLAGSRGRQKKSR